jgi:5-(carboxyamino)imidazole ribonucleotide synthase
LSAILPGATIGILGGGQLGRMTAMAARTLGYHLYALDPDPSCAARFVVERCFTAQLDDAHAAAEMASGCQVVTLEIEKISLTALEAAREHAPVRPGPHVLEIVQDRARQKAWLAGNGFPLGPYREANNAGELAAAVRALDGRCFAKATRGGYDGKGQVVLSDAAQAAGAWDELGRAPMVVEKGLDLEAEISVMVARRPSGEMAVFPAALNHHEDRILAWSVLPAPLPAAAARLAEELARGVAEKIDVVGLLAVEMFVTRQGELLVNELAPRPHNSFHATEVGCATSQFEQAVRAICDLPLGSPEALRPAAICNLLGDLWIDRPRPAFDAALALPGVRLHLYGKRVARPGRKMGHLSATGSTPEEAIARVQAARRALEG